MLQTGLNEGFMILKSSHRSSLDQQIRQENSIDTQPKLIYTVGRSARLFYLRFE